MATKPADGRFSWSYFLFGEGAKDWWRTLGDDARRLIIYGIVFLLVFFIWTKFFKKKEVGNVNRPTGVQSVVLTPGSKVGTLSQEYSSVSTQKTESEKRAWWIPHLYSGVAGSIRSKSGSDFQDYEPEIRVDALGLRWDWN